MFLSILSIPVFLLLCCCTPGVHGICDETELSCDIDTSSLSSCTISASNGTRTSYLIEKCSSELAQTGNAIRFSVYLTENNETITLDIAEGITTFLLYVYNNQMSIEFNKTQIDIQSLTLFAFNPAVVYCPYDFLNYFPSVTYLAIRDAVFDRFPYLNSTILRQLSLSYITLPNVVTILPSMIILPNLDRLGLYHLKTHNGIMLFPAVSTILVFLFIS